MKMKRIMLHVCMKGLNGFDGDEVCIQFIKSYVTNKGTYFFFTNNML